MLTLVYDATHQITLQSLIVLGITDLCRGVGTDLYISDVGSSVTLIKQTVEQSVFCPFVSRHCLWGSGVGVRKVRLTLLLKTVCLNAYEKNCCFISCLVLTAVRSLCKFIPSLCNMGILLYIPNRHQPSQWSLSPVL